MIETKSVFKIGLLNYENAQQSALFGLADFFNTASGLAASSHNIQMDPVFIAPGESYPDDLTALLFPPCLEKERPKVSPELVTWIRQAHANGVIICSVCAGAWILSATGLLDGRQATTHWQLADGMQQAYPLINFKPEHLIIDDGDIMTAGGVMAWTDLGLRLIERFMGPSLMMQVARQFLVEPGRREQRYFTSFTPRLQHGDTAILAVQHVLQRDFASDHNVDSLAREAGLSSRTFQRRFKQVTGLTPVVYLQNLRVARARTALETGRDSFAQITWAVGYDDPSAFQKLFVRIVGLGPQEYRRRFGVVSLSKAGDDSDDQEASSGP